MADEADGSVWHSCKFCVLTRDGVHVVGHSRLPNLVADWGLDVSHGFCLGFCLYALFPSWVLCCRIGCSSAGICGQSSTVGSPSVHSARAHVKDFVIFCETIPRHIVVYSIVGSWTIWYAFLLLLMRHASTYGIDPVSRPHLQSSCQSRSYFCLRLHLVQSNSSVYAYSG